MATIYDIAQACGVSTATVSYVLNGHGDKKKISKTTQELVIETARQMNFKPSLAAKQLNDKEKNTNYSIALFWPTDTLILEQSIYITSINDAIKNTGLPVDIILRPFTRDYLSEESTLFSSSKYNGAILVSPSVTDVEKLKETRPEIPIVMINRSTEDFCSVNIDNAESGTLAAQLLVKAGGENITALFGAHTFHNSGASKRSQSFVDQCQAMGIDPTNNMYYINNTIEDGYRAVSDIINKGALGKAIYSSYDSMTIGALSALNSHGYTVGKDVYLVSAAVGLPALMEYSIPPVTVIDLQTSTLAVRALHMVLDLIRKNISAPASVTYHPKLIYRSSYPAIL